MGEYHNTQLGKETQYQNQYDPTLLFPIERASARSGEVPKAFEFFGNDAWTAYELSWLNLSGKPVVAVARFKFPCNSKYVIESKSFKLYLNSLIQSKFASKFDVMDRLASDLSRCCGEAITIDVYDLKEYEEAVLNLKKGKITKKPVKTKFGYHIIILNDIRDSQPKKISDIKQQIVKRIKQNSLSNLEKQLRKNKSIKISDFKKVVQEINN